MCVSYETDMIIFNTIKEDVRDIVMEVIKEFKESYDKEINEVCSSLIDEMAIETLIDLLHDEKKELFIYEDFNYTFSKDILDKGMLGRWRKRKLYMTKLTNSKVSNPFHHHKFKDDCPDYY